MAAIHLNPISFPASQTQIAEDDECEYEFLCEINRGAYGIVHRALHKKSNTIVAMKEELEGLSPSTRREIDTFKTLGPHPCIVAFKDVFFFRDDYDDDERVFVVMEHMKSDLDRLWLTSELIPSDLMRETANQTCPLHVIKYVMRQILAGVAFLHGCGVMHRDIKPANILVGESTEIKICDFGFSARFGGPARNRDPEVGTLWYRAPELLMGSRSYGCEVDMWAVGCVCVMAELLTDDVIFPGETEAGQLELIRGCVKPQSVADSLRRKMEIAALFVEAAAELSPAGFDLLERLLAYEPEKRISAGDALDPAWFRET